MAKYTVMVSKHHCGQTFSTHLVLWEERSPVRRGCATRIFFLMFFCGKNVLVLKYRILGGTEFQKTRSYMTRRPDCSGPSRRVVKIDVCKYLQPIVMGLYAVSEQKLAHPVRVLSLVHHIFENFEKFSTILLQSKMFVIPSQLWLLLFHPHLSGAVLAQGP